MLAHARRQRFAHNVDLGRPRVDFVLGLRWVRVFPRGCRGSALARLSQLHAPVARAHVGRALEALGALRVAPVVHHGGREALALGLRRLLRLLLAERGIRRGALGHAARRVRVLPCGRGLVRVRVRVRVTIVG